MTAQAHEPRIPEWTLQDKLRKARTAAGFDQTQLAHEMGISRALVSGYELGTMKPRRSNVIAWAFACNVDPHWMLPHLDSNQEPSDYTFMQVTAPRVRHLRSVS